jgi:AraC-like DNA-binding protein
MWFQGMGFSLFAQGAKRMMVRGEVTDFCAGDYLVTSVDLPLTGRYSAASAASPALGIGMDVDALEVADLLYEADARLAGSNSADRQPSIVIDRADPALIDAFTRLGRLLDHPADIPVLAPLIRREITWRLITGRRGEEVRVLAIGDGRYDHVSRAIRTIRSRYAQNVSVEELAADARMSVSAFHRTFRAITGTSPIRFQKTIRLREARQLLVSSSVDIGDVSRASGYVSPSQFNRDYHREFGITPSQDRAAARRH